jgi:hypothetical protein
MNTVLGKQEFKTWKTIKLGTGLQTAGDFRKAIKSAGMKINGWANDVLGAPAFTVAESEMEVELVVCSVAELGFKDGAIYKDIYVRAQELGLNLCPPEVGPQLRLQYTDQPKGEYLSIVMESVAKLKNDGLSRFTVKHLGYGRQLTAFHGLPDVSYSADSLLVFLRSK